MTQSEAINILKLEHNVFLTGAAGTGKTYVLNEFIKYLQSYYLQVLSVRIGYYHYVCVIPPLLERHILYSYFNSFLISFVN